MIINYLIDMKYIPERYMPHIGSFLYLMFYSLLVVIVWNKVFCIFLFALVFAIIIYDIETSKSKLNKLELNILKNLDDINKTYKEDNLESIDNHDDNHNENHDNNENDDNEIDDFNEKKEYDISDSM